MQKIETIKILFIIFLLVSFLAGGYFYVIQDIYVEGFDSNTKDETNMNKDQKDTGCPDLLIKSGSTLLLINTKLPRSDTNPLPFNSLDEYIHYVEIQKRNGSHCPVLFLQEETNTQGHQVYRARSDPHSYEGALPATRNTVNNPESPYKYIDASRESNIYNRNQYAGFDPTNLYVGRYSDLDKIHDSTNMAPISDNPMDAGWGGVVYTHNAVASGKYKDNEVLPPARHQNQLFEEKSDKIMTHDKMREAYLFYTNLNDKTNISFKIYTECSSTLNLDRDNFMMWHPLPLDTFLEKFSV